MDDIIKLNVGGSKYITFKNTLNQSIFFKELISNNFYTSKIDENWIFVDRDGEIFKYILNYLRSNEFPYLYNENNNFNEYLYKKLKNEADYYGLTDLYDFINKKVYLESVKKEIILIDIKDVPKYVNINTNIDNIISYDEKYWNCPRNIYIHNQKYKCGKQCQNNPEYSNGWKKRNVTKLIISTIIYE